MTATGAALIALILGQGAWLALRGGRVDGSAAPLGEDPMPRKIEHPLLRWPPEPLLTDSTQPFRRPEAIPRFARLTETHTMKRLPRIEQCRLIGVIQPSAHLCDDGSITLLCQPRTAADERSVA